MLNKTLFTVFLGLALMLVISGTVFAGEGDPVTTGDVDHDEHGLIWVNDGGEGWIGMIDDGRLNAFDLAAPVAIYYSHPLLPGGALSSSVTGIQIYTIDPRTGTGQVALSLSDAEINRLLSEKGAADCCLADANGVSLHYSTDGYFWVTTTSGGMSIYSFEWPDYTTRILPSVAPVAPVAA